jgi:hypothetical protein
MVAPLAFGGKENELGLPTYGPSSDLLFPA